ncbi:hypothetical protein K0M31_006715 [Melipona bicolor]|uniref:Uncharacterized protein n=1 Tax=Melipona bicolor TaxID=60889 RepID=A0AA40FS44_9HYME|nr:hypothetical protein K0M31_006715 [Melipona bicolor]
MENFGESPGKFIDPQPNKVDYLGPRRRVGIGVDEVKNRRKDEKRSVDIAISAVWREAAQKKVWGKNF